MKLLSQCGYLRHPNPRFFADHPLHPFELRLCEVNLEDQREKTRGLHAEDRHRETTRGRFALCATAVRIRLPQSSSHKEAGNNLRHAFGPADGFYLDSANNALLVSNLRTA